MNDRVPGSSGLPLRAMVMVLLFLGVVFLLVGLQAIGGAGSDGETSAVAGAANGAAERLRQAEWDVVEVGNLPAPPEVAATTVYFGEAEGEQQSAEDVGKLLEAPVLPRIPEVAEQPPGVVVLVTG